METTSVLTTGLTLDELRVEELEPRLEFDTFEICSYAFNSTGNCGVIRCTRAVTRLRACGPASYDCPGAP